MGSPDSLHLARMVKSADTADLKSADLNRSWGFKSPSGHQKSDCYACLSACSVIMPACLTSLVQDVTGVRVDVRHNRNDCNDQYDRCVEPQDLGDVGFLFVAHAGNVLRLGTR